MILSMGTELSSLYVHWIVFQKISLSRHQIYLIYPRQRWLGTASAHHQIRQSLLSCLCILSSCPLLASRNRWNWYLVVHLRCRYRLKMDLRIVRFGELWQGFRTVMLLLIKTPGNRWKWTFWCVWSVFAVQFERQDCVFNRCGSIIWIVFDFQGFYSLF